MAFNQIVDVSPLGNATRLATLSAPDNQINDVSVLSQFPLLQGLFLGRNPIGDVSPVYAKTGLIFLALEELGITSVAPFSGMTLLDSLWLDRNDISDLSGLPNFTNLFVLGLSGNPISDFTPIASLSTLGVLDLGNTGLGGPKQASVGPSGNGGAALDFLTDLTALQFLFLYDNQIVDLGPLSGLTSLLTLDLFNNLIADIAPLVANSGLGSDEFGPDTIELRDNQLAADDCSNIQTLIDRGADVAHDVECPQ